MCSRSRCLQGSSVTLYLKCTTCFSVRFMTFDFVLFMYAHTDISLGFKASSNLISYGLIRSQQCFVATKPHLCNYLASSCGLLNTLIQLAIIIMFALHPLEWVCRWSLVSEVKGLERNHGTQQFVSQCSCAMFVLKLKSYFRPNSQHVHDQLGVALYVTSQVAFDAASLVGFCSQI